MPHSPLDVLFALERQLGASWPSIRRAHENTLSLQKALEKQVAAEAREDASVVVVGSLGRFEATDGSDIDWTYLVDGQASVSHQQAALRVANVELLRQRKPGREGIFGSVAFSHGLVQYIGGEDDTNANLTRRILLLTESKPIGRREVYDRVIRALLDRYLSGDDGWMHKRTPEGVPRFLQNDVARYWRTMAVDFAYKQWTRDNEGWGLKSAKLRLSRKLLYVAGLLYCFSLANGIWQDDSLEAGPTRKIRAIEHLWGLSGLTPLDLLARAFMTSPSFGEAARDAFGAYDKFVGMLGDSDQRQRLQNLRPEDADDDELFRDVRELGKRFQNGLNVLFFESKSTLYPALIKAYGVF